MTDEEAKEVWSKFFREIKQKYTKNSTEKKERKRKDDNKWS